MFHRVNDMPWPAAQLTAELEYALRYGEPTREQLVAAADVVNAYDELLSCPARADRTLATLRRLERARRRGP